MFRERIGDAVQTPPSYGREVAAEFVVAILNLVRIKGTKMLCLILPLWIPIVCPVFRPEIDV